MKTIEEFAPSSRYTYDNKLMPLGFAQLDTDSDAWYFGIWASAERLMTVEYVEGDVITNIAETKEEFVKLIRKIATCDAFEFKGIDTFCKDNITEQFKALGLEDLLH